MNRALVLLGGAYLAGVWLDGVGSTLPSAVLPRTPNYFLQVAALFPKAATASIDYRAEGWVCADKNWEEFDTRPYFPLDADTKENRFQRVMHFFRDDRPTMHALEAYLIESHGSGRHEDGLSSDKAIVGVRFVSLRLPLPVPGQPLARVQRRAPRGVSRLREGKSSIIRPDRSFRRALRHSRRRRTLNREAFLGGSKSTVPLSFPPRNRTHSGSARDPPDSCRRGLRTMPTNGSAVTPAFACPISVAR